MRRLSPPTWLGLAPAERCAIGVLLAALNRARIEALAPLAAAALVAMLPVVARWLPVPGLAGVVAGAAACLAALGWLARSRGLPDRPLSWAFALVSLAFYDAVFLLCFAHIGPTPTYVVGVLFVAVVLLLEPPATAALYAVNYALVHAVVFAGDTRPVAASVVAATDAAWAVLAWVVSRLLFGARVSELVVAAALERRSAELALANERLAALNREKDEIMALAAHDLRSPLAGIVYVLGSIEGRVARLGRADLAAGLATARTTCADLMDRIELLLAAHHAERLVDGLDCIPCDLAPLARHGVREQLPAAHAKGITLSLSGPEEGCLAVADAGAFQQVLANLLSNAVKFSPPGTSVAVSLEPSTAGVVLVVRDQGPGVPPEDRPRLFEKFARGTVRPTAGEPTTGLGLYTVRRLVEAMGGSVRCGSAPGTGASFEVWLPASSGSD